MTYHDHTQLANQRQEPIRCAIITISDTRTQANDTSGALIREIVEASGHTVTHYQIVRDEPDELAEAIQAAIARSQCEVLLTNGGTGIARRDTTIEAVEPLLDKHLPGFGELFRMLSYAQIGAGAMLSRATAGVIGRRLIFCMPGSSNAVRLAMETLILPELPHLVWELVRQESPR